MITLDELADLKGVKVASIKKHFKRNRSSITHKYEKVRTIGGIQRKIVVDALAFEKSSRHQCLYQNLFKKLLSEVSHIYGLPLEREVQIEGYRFDFRIGDLYVEYDEDHHNTSYQRAIDAKKDALVKDIVRVKKDEEVTGLLEIISRLQHLP